MPEESVIRNEPLDSLGVLTREQRVRVINLSESGCLIETHRPLELGTVGRLQLRFGAQEYADVSEVVRCHTLQGAGSTYHIGMRFLWTTPRGEGSIRQAIARHFRAVATIEEGLRVM